MTHFESPFAEHMEAFVALKRAMGMSYLEGEAQLRRFDRYLAALRPRPETITRDLVQGWVARPDVSPHTLLGRATVVRQFCEYLARFDASAYVPDRSIMPARLPRRRPHIYTEDEVRALVRTARTATFHAMRPETISTIVLVVYATGLRAGEVCRLRIADVDLVANTLSVEKSKFCKSRLVPFSESLARELSAYLELRRNVPPADPGASLFLNIRRRAFRPEALTVVFHDLVGKAGVSAAPGHRRPRLHDMRHTCAVQRLLRWYREGVDVEAKLPLLSTYLGHVDVISTQVYLTATAELLSEASGRFERAYGSLVVATKEVDDDAR